MYTYVCEQYISKLIHTSIYLYACLCTYALLSKRASADARAQMNSPMSPWAESLWTPRRLVTPTTPRACQEHGPARSDPGSFSRFLRTTSSDTSSPWEFHQNAQPSAKRGGVTGSTYHDWHPGPCRQTLDANHSASIPSRPHA